jgi:KaiC/GvpD/RAD55 family RecA-like ATPase
MKEIRIWNRAELEAQPRAAAWLLEGMLPRGGLACLFGPAGVGKSFLAIDWAMSAAGDFGAWVGRKMVAGEVLYIAAEGYEGVRLRVEAWEKARQAGADALFMCPDAIDLLDDVELESFINAVRSKVPRPVLIVVDTLARSFGGDENSARDMGLFIKAADRLRGETGATVLIVHHTGKMHEKGARGSSALQAAADTMLELSKDKNIIRLRCVKQKDAEPFEPLRFVIAKVGDSAVLNPAASRDNGQLKDDQRWVLDVLANPRLSDGGALLSSELRKACGLEEKVLQRAVLNLVKRGFINVEGKAKSRSRRYTITFLGLDALDADIDSDMDNQLYAVA